MIFAPGFALPSTADFIKSFEGCRLTAYQDSGLRWTIGWGHTGTEVRQGLVWTQQEADEQFVIDLAVREATVRRFWTYGSPTPGQLTAVVSLSYNSGLEAVRTSHLMALVNQNSLLAAAREFSRWDHVGGAEKRGLLHRRLAEALVFVRDSAGA